MKLKFNLKLKTIDTWWLYCNNCIYYYAYDDMDSYRECRLPDKAVHIDVPDYMECYTDDGEFLPDHYKKNFKSKLIYIKL